MSIRSLFIYSFISVTSSIMRVIPLLSVILSVTLALEHDEILFCLFERTGLLYGQPFDDAPRSLNCGNTTYCQKITANFISVGNTRTNIVLKGCDGITVDKLFYGPKCKKEGCYEFTENDEQYHMCCCKGHSCNSNQSIYSLSLLIISSIVLLIR